MSFYAPQQRCPRCHTPLTQGALTCHNCGLALAGMGSAPRASRPGPPPSWQQPDPEMDDLPPAGPRFGSQSSSGPAMYRPGGQPAPRTPDPWDHPAGPTFRRPPSGYQQRPGASGSFSGPGNRFPGAGDTPTGYQRPAAGPRQPSAGWGYQDTPISYQGGSRGYQNIPAGYQDTPDDSWNTPGAWDHSAGARHAPADYPGTAGGYDDDEAAPMYGRSQAFRGAPSRSWQQSAPAAPGGIQHQYFGYFPSNFADEPPMPPPPGRGKKAALILLVLLVLLAGGGGAAYLFIQSKPAITVTSKYMVGTTPAGSATTSLHVTGAKFAARSAVSFLLDGQPEPGHRIFQSDASGALKGDLPITAQWALGQHNLTARDASGKTTLLGKTIAIVPQGQAGTPGPNGAPADSTSFTINVIIQAHDNNTGKDETDPDTLVVTGQPDPAGGTVCNPHIDTDQPHTETGTADDGTKFTLVETGHCSGTYKGGKITYKETFSDSQVTYGNGLTCTIATFVNQELDGSFTSATELSGTLSSDPLTFTCSNGKTVTFKAATGTWTGTIASS